MRHFKKAVPIAALLLLFASMAPAKTQHSGHTVFVKGTVAAKHPTLAPRHLKKDGDIYLKDRIETADRSYSILELIDMGKITVRPLSHFSILQYSRSKSKVKLRLDKGGGRIETGNIAETSPDHQTIETPLASINMQQAKVKLRLCEQDCAKDEKKAKNKKPKLTREVVARIVEKKGYSLAITTLPIPLKGKQKRSLSVAAPVYRSDRLITYDQGHLLIVFRDGSRITLAANSELQIKDYRWQEQGMANTMVLRLVRGGLRALTGKLGKENPDNFVMESPVATIGIRGTIYDLLLEQTGWLGTSKLPARQHTYVRQGSVAVKNKAGDFHLDELTGNKLFSSTKAPDAITDMPRGSVIQQTPPPELSAVDMWNLYAEEQLTGVPEGLYLFVEDGHVRVKGKIGGHLGHVVDLGRHETMYVDKSGRLIRLKEPKNFLLQDDNIQTATCGTSSYWSKKNKKCQCKKGSYWSKKHKKCRCKKGHYYSKKYNKCYKSRPKKKTSKSSNTNNKAIIDGIFTGIKIWGAVKGSKEPKREKHHDDW